MGICARRAAVGGFVDRIKWSYGQIATVWDRRLGSSALMQIIP
jgi:hypothetical protein